MFIAVLEDDLRRREAMALLLSETFPEYETVFFDNAPDMIAWLTNHLEQAVLLCLDHDLGPSRWRNDAFFEPESGRDMADFLAGCSPSCPVVIHTSNYLAVPGMLQALEEGGWSVERVVPFDDLTWLTQSWLPVLLNQPSLLKP